MINEVRVERGGRTKIQSAQLGHNEGNKGPI